MKNLIITYDINIDLQKGETVAGFMDSNDFVDIMYNAISEAHEKKYGRIYINLNITAGEVGVTATIKVEGKNFNTVVKSYLDKTILDEYFEKSAELKTLSNRLENTKF